MKLTNEHIKGLVECMGVTHEQELNCNECLDLVPEYVEQDIQKQPIRSTLKPVEYHLALCKECRDEYDTLRELLTDTENG